MPPVRSYSLAFVLVRIRPNKNYEPETILFHLWCLCIFKNTLKILKLQKNSIIKGITFVIDNVGNFIADSTEIFPIYPINFPFFSLTPKIEIKNIKIFPFFNFDPKQGKN